MSCPDHYKLTTLFRKDGSPAEVIDICDELAPDDPNQFQAIEYLLRCKKKGQLGSDLEKCKFYIDRMQAKIMEAPARPEPIDIPEQEEERSCNTCKYGNDKYVCSWSSNPRNKATRRGHECLGPLFAEHGYKLWEPRT